MAPGRGDLFAEITVQLPKNLSEREKDAVRRARRALARRVSWTMEPDAHGRPQRPTTLTSTSGLPPNAAFVISVAARLVGVHEQTLRYYERAGLLEPARSKGRIRLYSLHDLERVRQIRRLTDEMGVNLAGVEVIMRLTDHIRELETTIDDLQAEVRRLRAALAAGRTKGTRSMDMNKLTEKAQEAIAAAQRDAEQRHNTQLEPEHLLGALVKQEAGVVPAVLDKLGVPPSRVEPAPRSAILSGFARSQAPAAGLRVAALPAPVRGRRAGSRATQGRLRQHRALPAGDGRRDQRHLLRNWASPATACCRRCRRCAAASASPRRTPRRPTSRWRSTAAT